MVERYVRILMERFVKILKEMINHSGLLDHNVPLGGLGLLCS